MGAEGLLFAVDGPSEAVKDLEILFPIWEAGRTDILLIGLTMKRVISRKIVDGRLGLSSNSIGSIREKSLLMVLFTNPQSLPK